MVSTRAVNLIYAYIKSEGFLTFQLKVNNDLMKLFPQNLSHTVACSTTYILANAKNATIKLKCTPFETSR